MRSILKLLLSKNPLRQMAETDRKVLAVCLGAALVFWLILNLSRDYSITRPLTIDYLVDPERVLVGRMPESLEASVSGNGWNLIWESLRRSPIPVQVDVRNRENFRLSALDLERNASRKLSSSKLTISLPAFESIPILTTPKEGKRVPLISQIEVRFAEGHLALSSGELLPDSITLSGSIDDLEDLDAWTTQPLVLEDVSSDQTLVIGLTEPPEGITLSREEVSYRLEVEAFIQQSITVPIRAANGQPGGNYTFTPNEATLLISLPQSAYGSLRPEDFELVADLSGRQAGTKGNSVPLTLAQRPAIIVGARVEPPVVRYYLVE